MRSSLQLWALVVQRLLFQVHMTISRNEQLENIGLAWRLILAELGGRAISEAFFDPQAPSFKDVLATTWKELCDQRWLEELEIYGHAHYRLTGSGWMELLFRSGEGERPELRDSATKLSRALKAHVKGRHEDVTVELSRLAHESGLSPAWVSNAIESNLLESLHGRRGVQWVDRGTLVKIPLNFGIELIDHTADLRAELQEIQDELEHTKEELSEYRCPICQAPISSQDYNVPLSEDVYGFVVTYACGRCDTDGYGARLCPSDPKFPKLQEYELRFKEHASEPTWKWSCFAVGKTQMANQVLIDHGMGRTMDEAQERLIENSRFWLPAARRYRWYGVCHQASTLTFTGTRQFEQPDPLLFSSSTRRGASFTLGQTITR